MILMEPIMMTILVRKTPMMKLTTMTAEMIRTRKSTLRRTLMKLCRNVSPEKSVNGSENSRKRLENLTARVKLEEMAKKTKRTRRQKLFGTRLPRLTIWS